jgi:glucokinase
LAVKPADHVLAYDIGGSHVTAGLCLLEPLSVSRVAVAPLPTTVSSHDFISLLDELGQQLIGSVAQAAGASLAFPAPFAYDAGISHMRHKLEALYEVDLRTALAQRLEWAPERIRFLNDAHAALLGEVGAGAAKGTAKAVGIMLGTGIGFSIVRDGNLNDTVLRRSPGTEIWDIPYLEGIVEDVLSSRAIERGYQALTAQKKTVAAIALGAATDPDARAVFHTFGRHLGQVIKELKTPLEPEVVVVGGGISRSSHLFLPTAQDQLNGLGIQLVPSILLEKAPLIGAAMHWQDRAARQSSDRSRVAVRP